MAIHPELVARLKKLREFNQAKRDAEMKFRRAEAGKKPFFAQLYLKTEGKSVAEREHKVYASKEWQDYAQALADAETEYNYRHYELQIQLNAYFGELNTFKKADEILDREAI